MNRFRCLAAMLLVAASACSSHAEGMLPQAGNGSSPLTPAGSGKTAAALKITVPRPGASTSAVRRQPKYISPSSAVLAVRVNSGPTTNYALTATSPGCSTQVTTFSCTFSIPAPTGTDSFSLTILDAANNPLSENNVSATLLPNQATPVNVTLDGLPTKMQLVPAPGAVVEGSGNPWHVPGLAPEEVEAQPLDADGNIIIGPGAPTLKSISISAGSSYASIAPAPGNNPNAYILTPNGATAGGQQVTVSATANGMTLNDGTQVAAPPPTATSFLFTPALLVQNGLTANVYSVETGNLVQQFTICPSCRGTWLASGAISDASGDLYLSLSTIGLGRTSQIFYFPAGATTATKSYGSANGVRGIGGMAVDKNGMLYVANQSAPGFPPKPANIIEIPSGATSPSVTITGGVVQPQALGVDGSGNVYLATAGGPVKIYGPGAQTAPKSSVTVAGWNPTNLAVDAAGDFYVTDGIGKDIDYFKAGNTTPNIPALSGGVLANISGSAPLLLDPTNDLWVSITNVGANNFQNIQRLDQSELPTNGLVTETLQTAGSMAWIP